VHPIFKTLPCGKIIAKNFKFLKIFSDSKNLGENIRLKNLIDWFQQKPTKK